MNIEHIKDEIAAEADVIVHYVNKVSEELWKIERDLFMYSKEGTSHREALESEYPEIASELDRARDVLMFVVKDIDVLLRRVFNALTAITHRGIFNIHSHMTIKESFGRLECSLGSYAEIGNIIKHGYDRVVRSEKSKPIEERDAEAAVFFLKRAYDNLTSVINFIRSNIEEPLDSIYDIIDTSCSCNMEV